MKALGKRSRGYAHFPDDTRRPVWLEATESFYKKLNRIAKECEMSRYDALNKGLDALLREAQIRSSALNRNIKSPAQSEVFRRTMGQVSRNYWATISEEEKRERARKSAQARWNRYQEGQPRTADAHRKKSFISGRVPQKEGHQMTSTSSPYPRSFQALVLLPGHRIQAAQGPAL